jgi:hypothetical protein
LNVSVSHYELLSEYAVRTSSLGAVIYLESHWSLCVFPRHIQANRCVTSTMRLSVLHNVTAFSKEKSFRFSTPMLW